MTAIELMPVATFPGDRGWGYDGIYAYAPHPAYGGPGGLARLRRRRARAGLGVILDVVYNHVGPGAERSPPSARTSPTATRRSGATRSTTRRTACASGRCRTRSYWVRDFHLDGLRLDATHAVFDDRPRTSSPSSPSASRGVDPRALVISEMETGDLRPIEEWGHDAQWADELHHEQHVLLTGEREGYYGDYGSVDGIARQSSAPPRAARRLHAEPRPGRQPRVRRPAAGASCAPLPALCSSSRRRRRCCSWARSTATPRRSSSSPTTSTRRSPRPRARPPARVRRLRRLRRRGRARPAGPARRSCARSSTVDGEPELRAFYRDLLRAAARAPARGRGRRDERAAGSRVRRGRGRARGELRPRGDRGERPATAGRPLMRGLARAAVPARRDVGRRGDELLALLRERRAGRALPLRRGRRRDADRGHRAHGLQLALLPARRRPRAALRLPRPRRRTTPARATASTRRSC